MTTERQWRRQDNPIKSEPQMFCGYFWTKHVIASGTCVAVSSGFTIVNVVANITVMLYQMF